MIDFIKKNVFIIVIFLITLFIGFVTFLTFIDKSFLKLSDDNLQILLIGNIGLLILLFFMILLGSMITASVFFSMILGHWYLNVINLPITLLKRSIVVFSLLLVVRTLWDVIYMSIESVTDSYGISYNLWAFTFEFDGFLLAIAMFMGNVVPLILNLFIWKTLKLQATQSATGLIYVSVLSILFGDLLFKYYLLKFGFLL